MKRSIDVKSVYGQLQRTGYEYIKILSKEFENNYNVLVIDDKDGLCSIPFALKGAKVTLYEPDERFIYGGIVNEFIVQPIYKRKNFNKVCQNIEIVIKNFYEERIEKKYEFVYCYRSIHQNHNKHISMKRKIQKILSSVKEGGYVYILYYLVTEENNMNNFCKNQYLRNGEMINYFDKKHWKIISNIEDNRLTQHNPHPGHNMSHYHRVGRIFAKKKKLRVKYKYKYNIYFN